MYSDSQQSVSSFVDNVNAGGTDVGIRVSKLLNNMGAHSQGSLSFLTCFFASEIRRCSGRTNVGKHYHPTELQFDHFVCSADEIFLNLMLANG